MHEPHHTSHDAPAGSQAPGIPTLRAGSHYAAAPASSGVFAVRCAGFADVRGAVPASDSLLVQTTGHTARRILAIGSAGEVAAHPARPGARQIELPGWVLAPALVNAHAHLDLTHVGPRAMGEGGFAAWIDMVRRHRLTDEAAIAASVRQGADLLRQGGTAVVGDIAGSVAGAPSLAPARVLDDAGFLGVSFLEFFGLSPAGDGLAGLDRALERARGFSGRTMRPGLQPHAPYSVSREGYRLAQDARLPLCTHLAESPAEKALIAHASGPIRTMLDGLGLWSAQVAGQFGRALSPIAHLEGLLEGVLAVHLNDLGDDDIELLARGGARAAYCPRASAYFGAPAALGPHRYADLLSAGVPVALGTDSIINLPADAVESRGICVLDEARLLLERDGAAPGLLLEMLYGHGPRVLGLEPFELSPGAEIPGLIAVASAVDDPARGLLASTGPISFL